MSTRDEPCFDKSACCVCTASICQHSGLAKTDVQKRKTEEKPFWNRQTVIDFEPTFRSGGPSAVGAAPAKSVNDDPQQPAPTNAYNSYQYK